MPALGSARHCVFCQSAEARRKTVGVVASRTKSELCRARRGGEDAEAKPQLAGICRGSLIPNQSSKPPRTTGPAARESQSRRALQRGPGTATHTAAATSPPWAQGPALCKPPQYWGLHKSHLSAVPASDTPAPPPGHEGAERKACGDPTRSGQLGGGTGHSPAPAGWQVSTLPACVPLSC